MNSPLVDSIVEAVLYEGYILYPYRPSVKNRQRWTFGGLYPEAYCRAQGGSDAPSNQTECLVQRNAETTLDVTIRFLQLTERIVGEITPAITEWPDGPEPAFRPVESLSLGGRDYHGWQEAEERKIELTGVGVAQLQREMLRQTFTFPARRWLEPLPGPDGRIGGVLVRQQQALEGVIEVGATRAADELFKVTLRVVNGTPLDETEDTSRDGALLRTLVSTHTILGVHRGAFVSLLDPPEPWREAAAGCRNVGTWPVLVGEEGQLDTMLSSPIILYDYPQVAPESPGNLYDGMEIDEILTLRILTLTDEEKRAAVALDGRAGDLLARTEALAREQLSRLHGTVRSLRPLSREDA